MNDDLPNRSDVVVAGFGSPHGDDQAGWQVVATLRRRPDALARLVSVTEGTQLLNVLEGCRRLIVVDACRSGGQVGTISRFAWPDPRIRQHHNHSTHGIGLCNTLQLADRLGRIPSMIEVFGIEIGDVRPESEASAEVQKAVDELAEIISVDIREVVHA